MNKQKPKKFFIQKNLDGSFSAYEHDSGLLGAIPMVEESFYNRSMEALAAEEKISSDLVIALRTQPCTLTKERGMRCNEIVSCVRCRAIRQTHKKVRAENEQNRN